MPMTRRCRRAPAIALLLLGLLTGRAGLAAPDAAGYGWADVQRQALDDDPQVRAARAAVQAAQSRVEQLRSRCLPTVGLSATHGRSGDLENGRPVDRRVERADAVLRWNVYNGGGDVIAVRSAELELAATEADLQRARGEVAERLATAFIEVQRHDELLPVAEARRRRVDELVRLVERQIAAGKATLSDEAQASVARVEAELATDQLQADRASALLRLQALVGQTVRAVEPVAVLLPEGTVVPADVDANPSVVAARQRAAAARALVRTVRDTVAPKVDLDLRRRLSDRTSPSSSTTTERSWTVTVSWDLPVGGETFARRDETERRAEAAEAEAERAIQLARADLASLAPRIVQAEAALVRLGAQVARLQVVVRAGELQYEAGRRSLLDLIQAQTTLYDVESRRADQRLRLAVLRLRETAILGVIEQAVRRVGAAPA